MLTYRPAAVSDWPRADPARRQAWKHGHEPDTDQPTDLPIAALLNVPAVGGYNKTQNVATDASYATCAAK